MNNEKTLRAIKKLTPITQEKNRPERETKWTFSKILLATVMLSYFVVLVVGIYVVITILSSYPEYSVQALLALFGYAGSPVLIAIGFYSWKAKAENIIKYSNNKVESLTELLQYIKD